MLCLQETMTMKLFIICVLCTFTGLGFAQELTGLGDSPRDTRPVCTNLGFIIDEPCANCECVSVAEGNQDWRWQCVTTCPECPIYIVSQICTFDLCILQRACTRFPEAECKIPDCGTCQPKYFLDGEEVQCFSDCPEGIEEVMCFANPCHFEECLPYPMAECRSNYCGGCFAEFYDDQDNRVNCSEEFDCAKHNPCLHDGICFEGQNEQDGYFCLCMVGYEGDNCETTTPRLGYCPMSDGGSSDHEMCDDCIEDNECPGAMKCCAGGCCAEPRDSMLPNSCPLARPFMNCSYEEVCSPAFCPFFSVARCVVDHCGGCNPVYVGVQGMRLNCTSGEVVECPPGIMEATCLVNPCDVECSADPMARCIPIRCGGCHALFVNAQGLHVDCQSGEAKKCPNGFQEYIPAGMDPCADATCPSDPRAKCVAATCVKLDVPMMPPFEFYSVSGDRVNCDPGSGCPVGLPFANCSYEDVCSPQATCDFYPNARCLVDHCGGCHAVFVGVGGAHLDCTTGEVLQCPADMPNVACFVNPCDMAECPADPTARCVPVYCGNCHALFVNAEGDHVDCQSGEAVSCPRGLIKDTFMGMGMDPCEGAVCPANPGAKCLPSPCMDPNKPLDCPVEFFDIRARLVKCKKEKPGRCPMVTPGELGICFEECNDDMECGGYKKCCSNGCGHVCRDPFEVMGEKPGRCPMVTPGELGICSEECKDDTECDGYKKCCSNGCGHVCRDPYMVMNVKPGMCPMVPPGSIGICVEECRNDTQCMGNKKCCSNGCGHTCREPSLPLMKQGMCPMVQPGTAGICVEECMNDTQCMGNKKCCSNGCGHTCRDAMPLKPGMCPMVPPGTAGICVEECMNDTQCMGNKKCCSNGCGHTCREPSLPMKPGMCPMVPPGTAGICVEECRNDTQCMGNKKCCSNGCGHTCRDPMPLKPGMCPMIPPGTAGICVEECMNDTQCEGIKKCCSNGCGHTCREPSLPMKPGMCPMVPPGTAGICVEECRNDTQCMGNKKCCSNGCGHTCRDPMPLKPGMCPMIPPGTAGICVEECMNDTQCEGIKKCCSNGCGHTCREPSLPMKPGMCPMVPPGTAGICVEECRNDTQCMGNKKCCSNGCGHTCRDPMPLKPGMCPMIPPGTAGICVEECMNDTQCEGMKKCCSNGCGHTCREPSLPMKPGMCPMVQPGTAGICVEECRNDTQCMGNKKCCSNGCGHTCWDPMPLKPGMCPMIPPGTAGICVEECMNDTQCEGIKKCCSNGCGHTCREPSLPMKPGMCPMVPPGTAGICVEECRNDTQCIGNKKCCSNGCGHTCRDPMPLKPGMCPIIPPGTAAICVEECMNDTQCEGIKKCCSNGCGHTCRDPMPLKQGMCPMIPPGTAGICVEECMDDTQCEGIKKCCSNGCGHTCREPSLPMKPGVCPMIQPGTGGICVEECMDDTQCMGIKKCCSNGCGHTCREPSLPKKPGMCPMVPPGSIGICVEECRNDTQCMGNKKCCSNGCGHTCRDPMPLKPGVCPMVQPGTGGICVEECRNDTQCMGNKKCCSNGCGHTCREPSLPMKPGMCPMVQPGTGGVCVEECMNDTQCMGNKKCCSNGCGHTCREPESRTEAMMMKPGTCPTQDMVPYVHSCGECTSDSQCRGRMKCCNQGCCLEPIETPGQCPYVPMMPVLSRSPERCEEQCSSDSDCEEEGMGKKCCSNGCGTKCIEPIRERKPGTCPVVPKDTFGICVEECSGDEECSDRQKCCSNGCGHLCMDPQEQPGDCPHSMPWGMTMLQIRQSLCLEDEDCAGKKHQSKCCSYGCRSVCVEPVRVEKAGMCPMVAPDSAGICAQMCNGDQDCDGNKKCCSNGCGFLCVEPQDRPGTCPYVRDYLLGICVETCSGDSHCERGDKCCFNGCGHQCMPTVPVIKEDGECPVVDPRDESMQGDCESNCVSDNECPGRSRCCRVGCAKVCLQPRPSPARCSEDEPEERCDPNPCDHATCVSHPDAQCAPNMCGQCSPEFFDDQGNRVYCSGHTYCKGLSDSEFYMAGTVRDSSDGCNQCVCTGRGTWTCTKIDCGTVIQVSMVLNGTYDNVSGRKEMFINKLKMFLSSTFGLPTWVFRDFKISRGSIVVEFKVSDVDSMNSEQVDQTVDEMKKQVQSGELQFEFEGETLHAKTDSFMKAQVVEATPVPPKEMNDKVMLIAIGIFLGVVALVVVIAIISCVMKGKKETKEKQKSENLEFNDYSGSVVAKDWQQ
ncbi:neurogenic locus notch homolog protein 3-like isoform X7 [Asterias rubens]|uniref:neurogenic locus notch homolog protein 3-like isoform X7 n=1 Tax=Asterias rubens TaxID=7604 RepID=UPI00145553F1|nr:neurogenic locus notch homolog protein 3-like isoform X7 [Asterias rubens]